MSGRLNKGRFRWISGKQSFPPVWTLFFYTHCHFWLLCCVPPNSFLLFIANSVHTHPAPYFYLSPVCIQLGGYLQAYMPTGYGQRAWAPRSRLYSSPTRTMKHWSSNVWSQAACLKTPVSLLSLHHWASKSWPPTPPKLEVWSGWGPRWENLRGKVNY